MIDFRYHLVSIASVFLALAIGIVLGAGPLKGTISDTLAGEVAQLREDADAMRSSLAAAEADSSARGEVITALTTRSSAGLLAESGVSILALPGNPDGSVESATAALAATGAAIGPVVTLDPSWTSTEPPDVTDRDAAATQLRQLLVGDLPVGLAPERVLTLALGQALGGASPSPAPAAPTATDTAGAPQPTDEASSTDAAAAAAAQTRARILEILTENGLLTVAREGTSDGAASVVILAPAADSEAQERAVQWADLAGAIDDVAGVTVAGEATDQTQSEPADAQAGLISLIRDTAGQRERISTLDNLFSPVGDAALPFVVVDQLAGQAGHFGRGDDATELFPPVPAASDGS